MDTIQNPIKNTALADINATAQKADAEKVAKKEEYEAAKKQLSIWENAKSKALAKLKDAQSNAQNMDDTDLKDAQAAYDSIIGSYTSADNNVDILRGSYLDSIFYSGKMNTCAILANDRLA